MDEGTCRLCSGLSRLEVFSVQRAGRFTNKLENFLQTHFSLLITKQV